MSNPFDKIKDVFFHISLTEKILFSKHLSMMIRAGMTESEALGIIKRQIKKKAFSKMMDQLVLSVQNGQFLSEALLKFEKVFGGLFISIIKLGEVSGTLAENLNYLSDELKKSRQLRSKVKGAMIYPIILLFATVVIVSGLTFFVLPKIVPLFSSFGARLPITTRILMGTVTFLNAYFWLVGLVIIALVVAWMSLLRIPTFRYICNRVLIAFPVAGKIVVYYNMATITRTLGLLLKSGVKIVEAIIQTASVVQNPVYRKSLLEVAEKIKKGETLYQHFEDNPKLYPSTVSRMIEVGERTGTLNTNLAYLSEFYEGEVDEAVGGLSSVLEPAMIIVMGVLVGFVAISIITPIYEITQVPFQQH